MDKNIVSGADQENADAICARIEQDAAQEAQKMIERANGQAQNITAAAKEQAAANAAAAQRQADKDIEKDKDRLLSTLNLEKKRIILDGKQSYIDKVLAEVRAMAGSWRQDPGYAKFIADAVVEGIGVLEVPQVVVYYAAADEHIFNVEFLKGLTERCSTVLHQQCELTFNKSDFTDIGVIINSRDGRMMYDNRFSARLERAYDDVYRELLKEA